MCSLIDERLTWPNTIDKKTEKNIKSFLLCTADTLNEFEGKVKESIALAFGSFRGNVDSEEQ